MVNTSHAAAELGTTRDPVALVPGSAPSVLTLADAWTQKATRAASTASALRALPRPASWEGSAADGFDVHVTQTSAIPTTIEALLGHAARTLATYAETLQWAQGQAQSAIELWDQAEQATTQWHQQRAVAAVLPSLVSPAVDPGAMGRAAARSMLTSARRQLRDAAQQATTILRGMDLPRRRAGSAAALKRGRPGVQDLLSGMTGPEIAEALAANPALADQLAALPADKVAPWWRGLTDEQQDALIAAIPSVIGNLEGVAYTDRDTANRLWLDQQLESVRSQLDSGGSYDSSIPYAQEAAIADLLQRLRGLQNIQEALEMAEPSQDPPHQLISLTSGSPPLAAISVGDLDAAENVTFAIPGMYATSEEMTGWTQSSRNIYDQQSLAAPGTSSAVVAWMGYETPTATTVWGMDHAENGAPALEHALAGIGATLVDDPRLNVVAHSYGSTTAALALSSGAVRVNSFVTLGSAGMPNDIDEASDLHADEVFAGQATDGSADQWAHRGRWSWYHKVDPAGPTFGATTFGTDTGGDAGTAVTDHGTHTDDNSGYLDVGTESLYNVGLATTGQGDEVTPDAN